MPPSDKESNYKYNKSLNDKNEISSLKTEFVAVYHCYLIETLNGYHLRNYEGK
jgi:hypothetical protein